MQGRPRCRERERVTGQRASYAAAIRVHFVGTGLYSFGNLRGEAERRGWYASGNGLSQRQHVGLQGVFSGTAAEPRRT